MPRRRLPSLIVNWHAIEVKISSMKELLGTIKSIVGEEPMNEVATTSPTPLDAILADPDKLKDLPVETMERLFALAARGAVRSSPRGIFARLQRRAGRNATRQEAR